MKKGRITSKIILILAVFIIMAVCLTACELSEPDSTAKFYINNNEDNAVNIDTTTKDQAIDRVTDSLGSLREYLDSDVVANTGYYMGVEFNIDTLDPETLKGGNFRLKIQAHLFTFPYEDEDGNVKTVYYNPEKGDYEDQQNEAGTLIPYNAQDVHNEVIKKSDILIEWYDGAANQMLIGLYYDGINGNPDDPGNIMYLNIQGAKRSFLDWGDTVLYQQLIRLLMNLSVEKLLVAGNIQGDAGASSIKSLFDLTVTDNYKLVLNAPVTSVLFYNITADAVAGTLTNFLQGLFKPFGNKVDPFTNKYLGFKFSVMGGASLSSVATDMQFFTQPDPSGSKEILTGAYLTFNGTANSRGAMYNYISDISFEYGTYPPDDMKLDRDYYVDFEYGQYEFTGNLYIPLLNSNFDALIRTDMQQYDNSTNNVYMDYRDIANGELMMGVYYKNERSYIDISGMEYMYGWIDLNELGFPKVYDEHINLAEVLGNFKRSVDDAIIGIVDGILSPDKNDKENKLLEYIMAKMSMTEKDPNNIFSKNTETLTVDMELVKHFLEETGKGTYTTRQIINILDSLMPYTMDQIAIMLGVANAEIMLDNTYFTITLNVDTNEITIKMFTNVGIEEGEDSLMIFQLDIVPVVVGKKVKIAEVNFDDFKPLEQIYTYSATMEGNFVFSTAETVDMSQLLSATIGENSGKNTPYQLASNAGITFTLVYDQFVTDHEVEGVMRYQGRSAFELNVWLTGSESSVILRLASDDVAFSNDVYNNQPERARELGYVWVSIECVKDNNIQRIPKVKIREDVFMSSMQAYMNGTSISDDAANLGQSDVNLSITSILFALIEDAYVVAEPEQLEITSSNETLQNIFRVKGLIGNISVNAGFRHRVTGLQAVKNDYGMYQVGYFNDLTGNSPYDTALHDDIPVYFYDDYRLTKDASGKEIDLYQPLDYDFRIVRKEEAGRPAGTLQVFELGGQVNIYRESIEYVSDSFFLREDANNQDISMVRFRIEKLPFIYKGRDENYYYTNYAGEEVKIEEEYVRTSGSVTYVYYLGIKDRVNHVSGAQYCYYDMSKAKLDANDEYIYIYPRDTRDFLFEYDANSIEITEDAKTQYAPRINGSFMGTIRRYILTFTTPIATERGKVIELTNKTYYSEEDENNEIQMYNKDGIAIGDPIPAPIVLFVMEPCEPLAEEVSVQIAVNTNIESYVLPAQFNIDWDAVTLKGYMELTDVTIAPGMMGEQTFPVRIIVTNREIIPIDTVSVYPQTNNSIKENVPVVDVITVDPYDYIIAKNNYFLDIGNYNIDQYAANAKEGETPEYLRIYQEKERSFVNEFFRSYVFKIRFDYTNSYLYRNEVNEDYIATEYQNGHGTLVNAAYDWSFDLYKEGNYTEDKISNLAAGNSTYTALYLHTYFEGQLIALQVNFTQQILAYIKFGEDDTFDPEVANPGKERGDQGYIYGHYVANYFDEESYTIPKQPIYVFTDGASHYTERTFEMKYIDSSLPLNEETGSYVVNEHYALSWGPYDTITFIGANGSYYYENDVLVNRPFDVNENAIRDDDGNIISDGTIVHNSNSDVTTTSINWYDIFTIYKPIRNEVGVYTGKYTALHLIEGDETANGFMTTVIRVTVECPKLEIALLPDPENDELNNNEAFIPSSVDMGNAPAGKYYVDPLNTNTLEIPSSAVINFTNSDKTMTSHHTFTNIDWAATFDEYGVGQLTNEAGVQILRQEFEWCSDKYLLTLNTARLTTEFCDDNSLGIVLRNGGSTNRDLTSTDSKEMEAARAQLIDTLAKRFALFMEYYDIQDTVQQIRINALSSSYESYESFFNQAKGLYNGSNVSFTKNLPYTIASGAVIGINKPYSMIFGNDESLDLNVYRTVVARLFGYDNVETFLSYADILASVYKNNTAGASNTNRFVYNGAVYSSYLLDEEDKGSKQNAFVMPYVFCNEQVDEPILAFVIVDSNGMMSVWINDIDAALRAANIDNTLGIAENQSAKVDVYGRCVLLEKQHIRYYFQPSTEEPLYTKIMAKIGSEDSGYQYVSVSVRVLSTDPQQVEFFYGDSEDTLTQITSIERTDLELKTGAENAKEFVFYSYYGNTFADDFRIPTYVKTYRGIEKDQIDIYPVTWKTINGDDIYYKPNSVINLVASIGDGDLKINVYLSVLVANHTIKNISLTSGLQGYYVQAGFDGEYYLIGSLVHADYDNGIMGLYFVDEYETEQYIQISTGEGDVEAGKIGIYTMIANEYVLANSMYPYDFIKTVYGNMDISFNPGQPVDIPDIYESHADESKDATVTVESSYGATRTVKLKDIVLSTWMPSRGWYDVTFEYYDSGTYYYLKPDYDGLITVSLSSSTKQYTIADLAIIYNYYLLSANYNDKVIKKIVIGDPDDAEDISESARNVRSLYSYIRGEVVFSEEFEQLIFTDDTAISYNELLHRLSFYNAHRLTDYLVLDVANKHTDIVNFEGIFSINDVVRARSTIDTPGAFTVSDKYYINLGAGEKAYDVNLKLVFDGGYRLTSVSGSTVERTLEPYNQVGYAQYGAQGYVFAAQVTTDIQAEKQDITGQQFTFRYMSGDKNYDSLDKWYVEESTYAEVPVGSFIYYIPQSIIYSTNSGRILVSTLTKEGFRLRWKYTFNGLPSAINSFDSVDNSRLTIRGGNVNVADVYDYIPMTTYFTGNEYLPKTLSVPLNGSYITVSNVKWTILGDWYGNSYMDDQGNVIGTGTLDNMTYSGTYNAFNGRNEPRDMAKAEILGWTDEAGNYHDRITLTLTITIPSAEIVALPWNTGSLALDTTEIEKNDGTYRYIVDVDAYNNASSSAIQAAEFIPPKNITVTYRSGNRHTFYDVKYLYNTTEITSIPYNTEGIDVTALAEAYPKESFDDSNIDHLDLKVNVGLGQIMEIRFRFYDKTVDSVSALFELGDDTVRSQVRNALSSVATDKVEELLDEINQTRIKVNVETLYEAAKEIKNAIFATTPTLEVLIAATPVSATDVYDLFYDPWLALDYKAADKSISDDVLKDKYSEESCYNYALNIMRNYAQSLIDGFVDSLYADIVNNRKNNISKILTKYNSNVYNGGYDKVIGDYVKLELTRKVTEDFKEQDASLVAYASYFKNIWESDFDYDGVIREFYRIREWKDNGMYDVAQCKELFMEVLRNYLAEALEKAATQTGTSYDIYYNVAMILFTRLGEYNSPGSPYASTTGNWIENFANDRAYGTKKTLRITLREFITNAFDFSKNNEYDVSSIPELNALAGYLIEDNINDIANFSTTVSAIRRNLNTDVDISSMISTIITRGINNYVNNLYMEGVIAQAIKDAQSINLVSSGDYGYYYIDPYYGYRVVPTKVIVDFDEDVGGFAYAYTVSWNSDPVSEKVNYLGNKKEDIYGYINVFYNALKTYGYQNEMLHEIIYEEVLPEISGRTESYIEGMTTGNWDNDTQLYPWGSELYQNEVTDVGVVVEYCDDNVFGKLLVSNNITSHTMADMPVETVEGKDVEGAIPARKEGGFDNLSANFAAFISQFAISSETAQWRIGSDHASYEAYNTFFEGAKTLFRDKANNEIAKNVSYTVSTSAVIGINKPFSIIFGSTDSMLLIEYQTVVARLFGFSSVSTFIQYAGDLVEAYTDNAAGADTYSISNRLKYDGAIFTENGFVVLPFAFKNNKIEGNRLLLAYVILDTNGNMSIWLSDIDYAFRAVNYDQALKLKENEKATLTVYGRCVLFEIPHNLSTVVGKTWSDIKSENATSYYYLSLLDDYVRAFFSDYREGVNDENKLLEIYVYYRAGVALMAKESVDITEAGINYATLIRDYNAYRYDDMHASLYNRNTSTSQALSLIVIVKDTNILLPAALKVLDDEDQETSIVRVDNPFEYSVKDLPNKVIVNGKKMDIVWSNVDISPYGNLGASDHTITGYINNLKGQPITLQLYVAKWQYDGIYDDNGVIVTDVFFSKALTYSAQDSYNVRFNKTWVDDAMNQQHKYEEVLFFPEDSEVLIPSTNDDEMIEYKRYMNYIIYWDQMVRSQVINNEQTGVEGTLSLGNDDMGHYTLLQLSSGTTNSTLRTKMVYNYESMYVRRIALTTLDGADFYGVSGEVSVHIDPQATLPQTAKIEVYEGNVQYESSLMKVRLLWNKTYSDALKDLKDFIGYAYPEEEISAREQIANNILINLTFDEQELQELLPLAIRYVRVLFTGEDIDDAEIERRAKQLLMIEETYNYVGDPGALKGGASGMQTVDVLVKYGSSDYIFKTTYRVRMLFADYTPVKYYRHNANSNSYEEIIGSFTADTAPTDLYIAVRTDYWDDAGDQSAYDNEGKATPYDSISDDCYKLLDEYYSAADLYGDVEKNGLRLVRVQNITYAPTASGGKIRSTSFSINGVTYSSNLIALSAG